MKNLEKLAARLSQKAPRHRASVFVLAETDADLVTEDEKGLLHEVAEGKDPFEQRRLEKKKNSPGTAEVKVDLHMSGSRDPRPAQSFAVEALKSGASKLSKYKPDPQFGAKNPEVHRFLMRVHKLLKEGEDLYQEIPEDPLGNLPIPPKDPVMYDFQDAYRSLKEAMEQLKEHYQSYGEVADKWVTILRQRFVEYVPIYNELHKKKSKK